MAFNRFQETDEEKKVFQEAVDSIGLPKYPVGTKVSFEYVNPSMGMVSYSIANLKVNGTGLVHSAKPSWIGHWCWKYRIKESPDSTTLKLVFESEIKEAG